MSGPDRDSNILLESRMGKPYLTTKEALVLRLLETQGKMYGLQLVEKSENQLTQASIYVLLGRMASKGYVDSWQERKPPGEPGPPRRIYTATDLGKKALRVWEATQDLRMLADELKAVKT